MDGSDAGAQLLGPVIIVGVYAVVITASAVLSYVVNNTYIILSTFILVLSTFVYGGAHAIWHTPITFLHKLAECVLLLIAAAAGMFIVRRIVVSLWTDIVLIGVVRRKQSLFMAKLGFGLLHLLAPTIGALAAGLFALAWYTDKFALPYPNFIASFASIFSSP